METGIYNTKRKAKKRKIAKRRQMKRGTRRRE
jgi:hypothetical protein